MPKFPGATTKFIIKASMFNRDAAFHVDSLLL